MRICQVIQFFVVFEKFGTLLLVLDMEAAIKSAASAASRKTKSRGSMEAPRRRLGKRMAAALGASLDLGPLDVGFLEAALAADLITA